MSKQAARVAGRRSVIQSRVGCVALLATASTFFAATVGFTAPAYDGLWSVSIVTNKGDCIGSYRYPMRISHGVLANGGDLLISVNGKVSAGGAVTVSVTQGSTSAVGSGRLSGGSGRGSAAPGELHRAPAHGPQNAAACSVSNGAAAAGAAAASIDTSFAVCG